MTDLTDRRWEYQFVRIVANDPHDANKLSALGAQGWRVIAVTHLPEERLVLQVLVERALIPPGRSSA